MFTVYILNIHHRTPELHKNMPESIKKIFLQRLPKILFFRDLMNEYNNFKNDQYNEKRKLLLKSSMDSMELLERMYRKNILLTKESCISNSSKKDYYGSEMLLIVESQNSNQINCKNCLLGASPEKQKKLKKPNSCKQKMINNLIVENIGYLIDINEKIKKDYRAKMVKFV
jgi:hypothetical protein